VRAAFARGNFARGRVQGSAVSAILRTLARGNESHARSVAKAVSWRMTGSIDTFVLSYVITGNATFAGSIAATEIVTKIVLYYFHERLWSLIGWGK
jgi:uncharacterized membrane protein